MSSPHRRHRQARAHFSSPYQKHQTASRPRPQFTHPYGSRAHTKIAPGNTDISAKYVDRDLSAFMQDTTVVEPDLDGDNDKEDATFHWEEEETLFSELMNDGSHHHEDHDLDELIESLQDSFTDQGTQAKKQIADIMVGTRNHIKRTLKLIDDNVDPYYGNGLSLFRKGSTGIEGTCYARQLELTDAFNETQRKIEVILDELKAEFAHRDKLWTKLEASINEIANPVLEAVKDTPAQIERTIANLEKQLEIEMANDKSANTTNKILQELLKGS